MKEEEERKKKSWAEGGKVRNVPGGTSTYSKEKL